MKIQDLLQPVSGLREYAGRLEGNPLTQDHALQEAQLLDVRLDAVTRTVGVLFELRLALQLHEANTGVLVASGVRELSWSGPERETDLTAWIVDGSLPRHDNRLFSLMLGMWPAPGAELNIRAENAIFCSGDVPDLPPHPDYMDSDPTKVRGKIANWDSQFVVVGAAFLERDFRG
jgi:hypothetical protein